MDRVNDNGSKLGDFKYNPATKTNIDYSYDVNGNMTIDQNKNISNISYNYLNLPDTIVIQGKGLIIYYYDASGNKLQKKTIDNMSKRTTVTSYVGSAIFQNDSLQYLSQEEGRVRVDASNTGYIFDYYIKDHLGNTRMVLTDDYARTDPILESTHYYPFGLTMDGISTKAAGKLENKFKYNGNEIQNKEFSDGSGLELYDFNARTYDQQIGRFIQIDPVSEEGDQESLTPYHFSGNNPSTFNDPNGKCPWCWGAIIGGAVEYATQVTGNLIQGESLGDALSDVKVSNILIAAGAGALSAGASAFIPKGAAKEAVVLTVGAAESAGKQYNETGIVSFKNTLTDVGANIIGDKLTKNVKVNSSDAIKATKKQLDRATRVAAGDAASSGRAKTVKKLEGKVSTQNAGNARIQQTAGGATSNATQAVVDNATESKSKVPAAPNSIPSQSKPAVDNANIKRPVIRPGAH